MKNFVLVLTINWQRLFACCKYCILIIDHRAFTLGLMKTGIEEIVQFHLFAGNGFITNRGSVNCCILLSRSELKKLKVSIILFYTVAFFVTIQSFERYNNVNLIYIEGKAHVKARILNISHITHVENKPNRIKQNHAVPHSQNLNQNIKLALQSRRISPSSRYKSLQHGPIESAHSYVQKTEHCTQTDSDSLYGDAWKRQRDAYEAAYIGPRLR